MREIEEVVGIIQQWIKDNKHQQKIWNENLVTPGMDTMQDNPLELPIGDLLLLLNFAFKDVHSHFSEIFIELIWLHETYRLSLLEKLNNPADSEYAANIYFSINILHARYPSNYLVNTTLKAIKLEAVFRKIGSAFQGRWPEIFETFDADFLEQVLLFAKELQLVRELSKSGKKTLGVLPVLTQNILDPQRTNLESAIEKYLLWANSSGRIWDGFLLTVIGESYFINRHLPLPPQAGFIGYLQKQLKERQEIIAKGLSPASTVAATPLTSSAAPTPIPSSTAPTPIPSSTEPTPSSIRSMSSVALTPTQSPSPYGKSNGLTLYNASDLAKAGEEYQAAVEEMDSAEKGGITPVSFGMRNSQENAN